MATIRIAAALIDDGEGRLLLVRKAGTCWFMQAGGKIEPAETPVDALRRELVEEIGLSIDAADARHLGRFGAPGAGGGAEIAEAVWIDRADAATLPLAPLTRDHVLPLYDALRDGPPAP